MNFSNDGAKLGIEQYRFAHNFDLKDKSFTIISDGIKYSISFIGRDKISFDSGKGAKSFDSECLKIEADTYFVRFGNNMAVFEISQGIVTLILPEGYIFGVIESPNPVEPGILHNFTDEMTDTSVRWTLGCFKFTDHVYYCADKCKASWSPKEGELMEYPTKYIKIKDGIYLVDITGVVPKGVCAQEGCDRIVTLQDYEHMMLVGCIFNKSNVMMISGYGDFPDA